MMAPSDDEKIVIERLKEFRPRPAKALNLPRPTVSVGRRFALAAVAAAIVAVVVGISLWPRPTNVATPTATLPAEAPAITIMQLNAATRREGSLDAVLARSARETLPATNRPNTALNALSKE